MGAKRAECKRMDRVLMEDATLMKDAWRADEESEKRVAGAFTR